MMKTVRARLMQLTPVGPGGADRQHCQPYQGDEARQRGDAAHVLLLPRPPDLPMIDCPERRPTLDKGCASRQAPSTGKLYLRARYSRRAKRDRGRADVDGRDKHGHDVRQRCPWMQRHRPVCTLAMPFTSWPCLSRPSTSCCEASENGMPSTRPGMATEISPARRGLSRLLTQPLAPASDRAPEPVEGARRLAHAAVALDAGREHLLGRAPPPILGREDLDLAEPGIAGGLDPAADAAQIDDAVAHHAAVVEQVARRHQPVADMEGEEAAGRAGAGDLA